MRIVGEIPHPNFKITIFFYNNRYSLKFENGLLEQGFRLRSGSGMDSVEDVKKLLNPTFLGKIEELFKQMEQALSQNLERILPPEEDQIFPEII